MPDSLLQKSYDKLQGYFNAVKNDFSRAEIYAEAYLKKSIAERDTVRQADAWYFLTSISNDSISEKYADNIISLTIKIKDDVYPAKGFLAKALVLQRRGKYQEALDQLFQADVYARASNNELQQLEVKYRIGILKTDLGEDEEALAFFRLYLHEAEKKYEGDKNNLKNYIKGLLVLGDAYNRNGKYDSAAIINKKGFEVSLKNKNLPMAKYFTLSIGVSAYLKKNYKTSLDSIQSALKAFKTMNDPANLTVCYLYIGKIYKDRGKIKDALPYFKKADSIVEKTSDVFPEIKDAYNSLIEYYEEKGDTRNQLKYVNRLMEIDSLLDINYKYLSKNIEKYDNEQLHRKKDKLIKILKRNRITWITALSAVVLFISAFTYYHYRRQRVYRARFETLLSENGKEEEQLSDKNTKERVPDLSRIEAETLDFILERLKIFVDKKEFCNNDVSLNKLAEKWGTNSRYLTDIIKVYEGKNFRDYVRDLRIDYTVERLKTDATFRKYSIEAIAQEAGYNTAEAFSKAFRTRTGILPSYFIKALKEKIRDKMHSTLNTDH